MIVEERDDKRFINEQNEEAKEHNNGTDSSVIKDDLCELEWSNFNYKQFLIWSLICFVILSVLIGTEFAYRDPLFDANSKTVSHFQYESTSFKDFMIALAYFGEAEGVAATLFIFVPILSYSDGIITLMLIFLTVYINGIMKILYHSPRPFFVAGDIKAYYCSKEYGNPSGHAMYIPSVLPLILYLVLRQIKLNLSISTKLFAVISTICIILMILLVSTILFGRIYLGVHSYNQVLYGSLLGILMLCFIILVSQKLIRIYISSFIFQKCELKKGIIHSSVLLALTLLLILIACMAYVINVETFSNPSSWIDAIISKCGISSSSLHENSCFERKGLLTTIAPVGFVGAIFGIIFFSILSNNQVDHQDFLPIWKTLLRFIINIAICIPFGCLALIPSSSSIAVLAIFGNFTPMFIMTFLIFGVNRFIFIKLSLLTPINSTKLNGAKIDSKDQIEENKEEQKEDS